MLLLLSSLAFAADPAPAAAAPATDVSAGAVSIGQVQVSKDASGTRLEIDQFEVDGAKAVALRCTLDKLPFMGTVLLVPAVGAGVKQAQTCATGGAAARTSWTWEGTSTTGVKVEASQGSVKADCVVKALQSMQAVGQGTCQAVVLMGDRAAAEAAVGQLK